jgi:hypothetical protein
MSHQVQQYHAQKESKQAAIELQERLHAVIYVQSLYRKRQAQAQFTIRLAQKQRLTGTIAVPQRRKEGHAIAQIKNQGIQAKSAAQNGNKHAVETQVKSAPIIKLGAWRGPSSYPEISPLLQALWKQKIDEEKATQTTLQSLTREQRQLARKITKAEVRTVHPHLTSLSSPPPLLLLLLHLIDTDDIYRHNSLSS